MTQSKQHFLEHTTKADQKGYTQTFTFQRKGGLEVVDETGYSTPIFWITSVQKCKSCDSTITYVMTKKGNGRVIEKNVVDG